MTGELITTGMTFGAGREALNTAFSGYANFNILSATTFFSGSTPFDQLITGGSSGNLFKLSTGVKSIVANNGTANVASQPYTIVAGGHTNVAAGPYSCVLGGQSNTANSTLSAIVGGQSNSAYGNNSSVLGGGFNSAYGNYSVVGGGRLNLASGSRTFIGGGSGNTASGNFSFIGSGSLNQTTGAYSTVLTGKLNLANSHLSGILGGSGNTIHSSAVGAVIVGMSGYSATTSYMTHMTNAYIDGYLDLNPQTSLPSAKIGRMFFSGTPLFKLMVNTGGTAADWMRL